jgi:hypothetical protein
MAKYIPSPQRGSYSQRFIFTVKGKRYEWLADDQETAVNTFCVTKHLRERDIESVLLKSSTESNEDEHHPILALLQASLDLIQR